MILYSITFIFGLLVGSFLNTIIYRLHSGESIITKRSHCAKCGHILAWYELVPVVSFIVQKGKCRACGKSISWQYPGVEIATGILFLLVMSNFQILTLFYYFVIISSLIIIFVYDLKHYLIPSKIIYPAIGLAFLYRVFEFLEFDILNLFGIWDLGFGIFLPFVQAIIAAIAASLFFFSIFIFSKGRAMGFGDVTLTFFIGLFLGWPNILPALFLSFLLGGIIGLGLIFSGKKTMKSKVPFGPFLVVGTFIAMFWGEKILNWYLDLLI